MKHYSQLTEAHNGNTMSYLKFLKKVNRLLTVALIKKSHLIINLMYFINVVLK